MYLKYLQLVNFKNYEEAEINLNSGINCFTGKNGAGKTNILDAVYYLSMCKSYMNVLDRQNIRFNEQFFSIKGEWVKDELKSEIHCAVKVNAKKIIRKNKKEYEKLADHIGQYPVVMISPYDRDLISEGSELRRKWIDGIISQQDKSYLEHLIKYNRVLEQRNALLKNMYEHGLFDRESIEVWNVQMCELGQQIYERRKLFIEEFVATFQEKYRFLGHEEENVEFEYRSQLHDDSFEDLLKVFERKDALSHYSNVGIHKDDLIFTINGHPIKKFGSQGQQKSFIIALRLAQFEWLKNHLGVMPVLMLDDVFDKLDQERVKKLLQLVSEHYFGQVLITDTDTERMMNVFSQVENEFSIFEVNQGVASLKFSNQKTEIQS